MQQPNKYRAEANTESFPTIPATYMNRMVRRALSGMNRHLLPKIWDEFFQNMAKKAQKPKESE